MGFAIYFLPWEAPFYFFPIEKTQEASDPSYLNPKPH